MLFDKYSSICNLQNPKLIYRQVIAYELEINKHKNIFKKKKKRQIFRENRDLVCCLGAVVEL